ncbi:hypothetical protein NESM_000308400 [Novymonas esmeraldas]|uniref:Uncharacterized protein n=1 Tax=Novymonas esmeraldas TaxID=1808958 RepID=A0AAW0EK01_9TRYP
MPSKQQTQSKALNGSAGKSSSSSAAAKNMATTSAASAPSTTTPPPPPPPPFNSIPHASSGDRLMGVEVSSSIPALMSELGELLQQTPGSGGGGSSGAAAGSGLWRGQNGGLLFEHLDGVGTSPTEAAAAAALFSGMEANRSRIDHISPSALERLSQVFSLQQRQTGFTSSAVTAATVAAGAAAAAFKRGSSGSNGNGNSHSSGSGSGSGSAAPATVEVLNDDDDGDADADSASGSSTAAEEVLRAVYRDGSGDHDASSAGGAGAAGRRHSLDEMFEMMQRSIGSCARGVDKGGSGDLSVDPAAYADPLTQLELFRAMMVATSKSRTGGSGGSAAAAAAATEGKSDEAASRSRTTSAATANSRSGVATPAGAASNADCGLPSHFRNFLDVLSPQLISQLMLQQRTSKTGAAAAAAASKASEGTAAAAAAAVAQEVDMATSGVANLLDLQQRAERVRDLSCATLEALADDEVSDSKSGSLRDLLLVDPAVATASGAVSPELELSSAKVGYCLTEAAAVAVSMLWSYLGNQQKEAPLLLGYTREEAQSQFNLLLFRLRQELFAQPPASLKEVSRCFGSGVQEDPEDIYSAINGVGVLLFFTCKPLALLEKACGELRISLSDSANADSNVMPELIAEKLAAFLYPMKEGKLTFAQLSFIPRLQVHEHAPGNYTCTIDNASNMGRMLRERLLSNRFSCNKIKWRAAIVSDKGDLKFQVWHRHTTPLSVHVLVRTSEPKKKRRSGAAGGEDKDGASGSGAAGSEELRASSALFMERQVTAAPGEMVGFTQDFLGLAVALSSPTTLQHGYRTYNKVDDRLVFQFSLQLSSVGGAPLDSTAAALSVAAANANTTTTTTAHARAAATAAAVAGKPTNDEQEPSVCGSTAGKTDGGDSKDDPDAELHAALRRVGQSESAARAAIEDTARWDYRHLQNDESREAHRAQQRAEDRERKALLAKAGPTPDLVKEVEKLAQSVQTAQQQIAKLTKEKNKDEKEGEKTAERLAQHQAELSTLLETIESGEAELARLEAETTAAESRVQEKQARRSRKEAKREEQNQWTALKRVLEPTSSTTHHDTLAINDFGSFLHSSSTVAAAAPLAQQLSGLAIGPLSSSSLFGSGGIGGGGGGGGGAGMPPLAGGGLSAFGTDPFSARGPMMGTSPSSGAPSATPVFSTQPKLGTSSSSSLGTNANANHHHHQHQHHNTSSGGGSRRSTSPGAVGGGHSHMNGGLQGAATATTPSITAHHPGSVSPMVPPSPGVMSNASAAMGGGRSSPASAVGVPIGSPGMPLSGGNGVLGGGGGGGGGLSFGLAPSLFSTNPVSHTPHSAGVHHNIQNSLYTSLDANAQPFSPSPPPTMPPKLGSAVVPQTTVPPSGAVGNASSSSGAGGFAFTVTAGAHPVLVGGTSSPLYTGGSAAFSAGSAHDIAAHSPSPFSTTPMSTPAASSIYTVNGGGHGSAHDPQQQQQQHVHPAQQQQQQSSSSPLSSLFPPRPNTPNELLSFSTGLQWRN